MTDENYLFCLMRKEIKTSGRRGESLIYKINMVQGMSALKTAHTYSGDRKKTCVSEAGCLGQEQGEGWNQNRDKTSELKGQMHQGKKRGVSFGERSLFWR